MTRAHDRQKTLSPAAAVNLKGVWPFQFSQTQERNAAQRRATGASHSWKYVARGMPCGHT